MDFAPSADVVRAKIEELRQLGLRFDATMQRLLSLENVAKMNAQAWAKWNDLRSRGLSGQSVIAKGVEAVRQASEWLRDTTGLSGVGLGFAPILIGVALAAIIAAISFASGWLAQADPEIRRLEILQAATADLPDSERAKILAAAANRPAMSVTGNLAQIALYAAIGIIAVFVLPKLLERK